MRLYPEKLAQDIRRQLRAVYLISGEETLLVQECCDQVRAAARRGGCSERKVLDASDKSFGWQDFLQEASSLSLFAERRLIELRIPSGKPGTEGGKALLEYLNHAAPGDVLLIIAGKIERASTGSKWYKAIDAAGASVQLWPVSAQQLPRWLAQRAQGMGLRVDREALRLLAERVEGNLLAAVQELEKLRLLAGEASIDANFVAEAVANSARFNLFGLLDAALAGRVEDSLRMLRGLRSEGAQPAALLWGFVRELQLLRSLADTLAAGRGAAQALSEARVWKNRQPVFHAALSRHTVSSSEALLALAARADGCVKAYAQGNPWEIMELLTIGVAGDGTLPVPVGGG